VSDGLFCSVTTIGDIDLIFLRGELDISSATGLADWLVGNSGKTIVIELSEMTFMDASGIAAIVDARNRLLGSKRELILTMPRGNVRRVFEVTGLDGWLYPWSEEWVQRDELRSA
jgi:anti-anti-sigma factor